MKGLIQQWVARQQKASEQRAIDARNAERRALCVEYANNKARRAAIVKRLAELSGEANIAAAAARIDAEMESASMDAVTKRQAELMRVALNPAFEHDHFTADMKHFRKEYCA